MPKKREWKDRRLSWDEKHMLAALTVASRSSCHYLHTGSVIVKNKRIKAEGYNGAGEGIENCLDRGCRKDEHGIDFKIKGTGNCRGLHGEANALDEISKEIAKDSTLYTVYYPCSRCATRIANYGVKEVVFLKFYKEPDSLTEEVFKEKGVKIRQLELDIEKCFGVMREVFLE